MDTSTDIAEISATTEGPAIDEVAAAASAGDDLQIIEVINLEADGESRESTESRESWESQESRAIAIEALEMLGNSGHVCAALITQADFVRLTVHTHNGLLSDWHDFVTPEVIAKMGRVVKVSPFALRGLDRLVMDTTTEPHKPMRLLSCVRLYRNNAVVDGSDVMISRQSLQNRGKRTPFNAADTRLLVTVPGFELRKCYSSIVMYRKNKGVGEVPHSNRNVPGLTYVTHAWLFINNDQVHLIAKNGRQLPVLFTEFGPFVRFE